MRIIKVNSSKAFSLIEMIGVLAIIGILASVVAPKVFDAIRDAKITGAMAVLQTIKSACTDYARKYNLFPEDGTKPPPTSYDRTFGDGAAAPVAEASSMFADLLIGEGLLEKLVLPVGPAGQIAWSTDLVTVASPTVPNGDVEGTFAASDTLDYPVIVCRAYKSLSSKSRMFTAAQNSTRIIMLVIPELTTLEAAGIKTKADGPFDEEVTDAVSLITTTIAGSATGRSKEAINRGNCRLKDNATSGRYTAFLYVAHE
jgi:prepilin-type N-terminal cleavage/methylation domain-containing protein